MSRFIAIDSGTTTTRIYLVVEKVIIQTIVKPVGITKSIDNKSLLKNTIKEGICQLLFENTIAEEDVECIICSGMITSEFGLVPLEHICAPVGLCEMQKSVYKCNIDDITSIPFVFIRGVKTSFSSLENADVMRGEETEVMGVFEGAGMYVLPGSHSKIIMVDEKCTIKNFKTTLVGEMLSAIANNTILKDAVVLNDYEIDKSGLLSGYLYTRNNGINEALFKVRILKNYYSKSPAEIYSFYLGALLQSEIEYMLSVNESRVYIGGEKAIKNAIALLLETLSDKEVIVLSDSIVENSLVHGMMKIYEGIKYE